MQIPRFSCKIFLHLIPEPEEKASELLRDLNANDIPSPMHENLKLTLHTCFIIDMYLSYIL